MNLQEYTSASIPYSLRYYGSNYTYPYSYIDMNNQFNVNSPIIRLPIVRKIDDITKLIIQDDYNNSEPFIPIVEILKINEKSYYESKQENSRYREIEYSDIGFHVKAWFKYNAGKQFTIYKNDFNNYPTWVTTMLLKWHFDLITEDCKKVYVSEEFNPYKKSNKYL